MQWQGNAMLWKIERIGKCKTAMLKLPERGCWNLARLAMGGIRDSLLFWGLRGHQARGGYQGSLASASARRMPPGLYLRGGQGLACVWAVGKTFMIQQ